MRLKSQEPFDPSGPGFTGDVDPSADRPMGTAQPAHGGSGWVAMDQQEWFTADEAAEFLRVSRSTIYRWAREDRLRSHVLPSGVGRRFGRADLMSLLRMHSDGQSPTEGDDR